ncbi:MAG: GWxTD domain-containing protein [Acidobacteria bacterium]|nr:GWxTD domain-containing protein [Acidobacteriota bacterium]
MKKNLLLLSILIGLLFLCPTSVEADEKAKLPPIHKAWLEEEVIYIISPVEREVFLQLNSDRERDMFIQAFWKQRDPTPGTPENEFRKEHSDRISHANRRFGRGTPKPGWKTDRGRMYIILGEPNDIQRFEGKTQVYPTEVWFYQGKSDVGLPAGFSLVFFQESAVGEYRLYSPLADGPQALLTSYYGDPMDYYTAYTTLREFEADLAEVSLSLIPGEGSTIGGRPSMISDMLIQRVEGTPQKKIQTRYARKFLEYKDIVEVEYSANYLDSDTLVKVIKDPSGLYFVHYAIEPARLSVGQYQNKYYTTLMLNGTVADMEGKTIHQFEKTINLEFDSEQIREIFRRPVSIRDMFPIIPGRYRMSVLVKNETSKEFTSLEREILIPDEEGTVQMTALILGYQVSSEEIRRDILRPFQMGPFRLAFQSNRVFLRQDELAVGFQMNGLKQELMSRGTIRYDFLQNDQPFHSETHPVTEYFFMPNILQKFSLEKFPPAHYKITAAFLLDGQEVISGSEEFDITHSTAIPRPWVYAKLLSGPDSPAYAVVLGTQLYNSGRYLEALELFHKAWNALPGNQDIALELARTWMALQQYREIPPLLAPLVDTEQKETSAYEVYSLLGESYRKLSEWGKAVEVFNKALSRHGQNTGTLNALGFCHLQLGHPEEALAAWEKSLEIVEDQPEIRKQVEILKRK